MTPQSTNFEKNFTFNLAFDLNDFPVSFGLLIFSLKGEIFLYFLAINKQFL